MGGWYYHWSCSECCHTAHSDSSCVPVEEKGTITVQNVRYNCTTCILHLHSHYNRSDSSTERRVSLSQTNQCYSSVQEPQPYEECQPNRQDHQPAAADGVYSYADHTVNTNVYDSVPQSNESSDSYGNSKEDTTMPTVDNIALYSLCEQENGTYSQLNRK